MVLGSGQEDSGTDGTRESAWFVLVSEWMWVVDRKIMGQMGQEKLHVWSWLLNGDD
jgi:hypothetical protein